MKLLRSLCLLSAFAAPVGCDAQSTSAVDTRPAAASAAGLVALPALIANAAPVVSVPMTGSRRTYNVGPGQQYAELTQVPFLSLEAGDVVNIHYRAEPYRTKIGLRAQGSASHPVVLNGVTDAAGRRPLLSGQDAVSSADVVDVARAGRPFFSARWNEFLGVIMIKGSPGDPFAYRPKFIQIKNLAVQGAAPIHTYTSQDGAKVRYSDGAAGIYAEKVEDLLVENCEITGNGNGIFTNTKNDDEREASYRITIRNNLIHSNGTPGSYRQHNLYIQAVRSVFEGNYIGRLVAGAKGSSLKDRSSGTIVRYNYIDAAARAIDLVETDGGMTSVFVDPQYHDAWVYGNIIVSDADAATAYSSNLIHWGGDNGDEKDYRKGTLYFYHNTVVTKASRKQSWRMRIFDLATPTQTVEARSNIFAHFGDANYSIMNLVGTLRLEGTNWIRAGWREASDQGGAAVTVQRNGTLIEGTDPGFAVIAAGDYSLAARSAALDRAPATPPASVADRWIERQFAPPATSVARSAKGAAPDLGALER
jgi:Right handed beta helix region